MKRIILSGLSVLVLASTAAPIAAYAQATPEAMPSNAEALGMAVTPFNLVFLAYQGFFAQQGIPKFDGLISNYQSGKVTSKDLVKVAVSMRRLPASTLENRGYLSAVDQQLKSLYLGGGK